MRAGSCRSLSRRGCFCLAESHDSERLLMGLHFLYPVMLWGLALLPLLVLIYLLRRRFQPRVVSSLIFWRQLQRPDAKGAVWQRVPLPWIVLLELLILSLLILSAAAPAIRTGAHPAIVCILDNSLSMQAEYAGESALSRGKSRLRALLAGGREFQLVLAQERPLPLAADGSAPYALLEGQWSAEAGEAALDKAIAWARKHRPGAEVYVFTDHLPQVELEGINWLAFGRSLPNAGLVGAWLGGEGDEARLLFAVRNFGDAPAVAALTVSSGGQEIAREAVRLAPLETVRRTLPVPAGARRLRVELPQDALRADNAWELVVPPRDSLRVALRIADERSARLWRRSFAAVPGVVLTQERAQMLVTDSPTTIGETAALVQLVRGADGRAFQGPFFCDRGSPLMEGVDLPGLIGGAYADWPGEGIAYCGVGDVPLLTMQGRRMWLNLIPEKSTLTQHPVWPVLVWNIAQWARGLQPGLRQHNFRAGEILRVELAPDESPELVLPDGARAPLQINDGRVMHLLRTAGVYRWLSGGREQELAVNNPAGEESDLRRCAGGELRAQASAESVEGVMNLSWALILAALPFLLLHLALVGRRAG